MLAYNSSYRLVKTLPVFGEYIIISFGETTLDYWESVDDIVREVIDAM